MSCVKFFVKNGRAIHILFPLFQLLGLFAANNQSNNNQIKPKLFDDYLRSNNFNNHK